MKKRFISKVMILVMALTMVFGMTMGVSAAEEAATPADGMYTVNVDTGAAMFKVVNAVLTSKEGVMTAVITLSGDGYDKLFMGTEEQALNAPESEYIKYAADSKGMYTFEIPVADLDTGISVTAWSKKNTKWYDRTLTFKSSTLAAYVPEEGVYNVSVDSNHNMFKVVKAALNSKGGVMTAIITLSGEGYDKLYMGTETEALGASEGEYINYVKDSEGMYTFEIPVRSFGTPINVAAYAVKSKEWKPRTLTFNFKTLEKTFTPSEQVSIGNGETETAVIDRNVLTLLSNSDVTLKTSLGTIVFDKAAMAGIVSGAAGSVTLSAKNITGDAEYSSAGYDMVVELKLYDSNGNTLFTTGGNGKAVVTIPYTKEVPSGNIVKVYYLTDSGKEDVSAVYNAENKTITFETAHFSNYAIVQEGSTQALNGQALNAQAADIPKTADGNSNMVIFSLFAALMVSTGVILKRRQGLNAK